MTPQKLWVLKAHTKSDKIDDFCQNIRQDFDIYLNIDHQKAKKLKKEQRRRTRHTNKQAIKQINKRTDEETTKTNKPSRLFFFWSDAMAGAIACGQTKQIKNIAQTEDAKTLHAACVKRNFQERHRAIVCFKKERCKIIARHLYISNPFGA